MHNTPPQSIIPRGPRGEPIPAFCFSRIMAATDSLSRCISLPVLVFFDFCRTGPTRGWRQRGCTMGWPCFLSAAARRVVAAQEGRAGPLLETSPPGG